MVDDRPANETEDDKPIELSAEDARGAEIDLRSPARRIIFFAGLAGFVILVLVLYFLSARP